GGVGTEVLRCHLPTVPGVQREDGYARSRRPNVCGHRRGASRGGGMNRALPPGAGPDRSRNPRGQPRPPWLVPGSLGLVCGVEDSRWKQKKRRRVVPSSATCQVLLIAASSAWTLCPAVPMYCYAALVCAIQSVCAFVATWPFRFCRSSRFGRP